MADLPDLDTAQISWIAYWNAIDNGGVTEIDPESALDNGNLQNYTLYDNGWEGDFSSSTRLHKVRVKTDGWIVAYLDRLDSFSINVNGPRDVDGQYDILHNWYSTIEQNTLERAINSLQNSLDSVLNYTSSDVGLYNYDHQATNITLLRVTQNSGGSYDYGLLLNELSVVYAAIIGRGVGSAYNDYGDGSANLDFEGSEVYTAPDGGNTRWGSLDISEIITTMQTEYLATITNGSSSGQYGGDDTGDSRAATMVLWDPV